MQKLWIDNSYELATPLLFCLGKHRLVNTEYNIFASQFKNSIEPITETAFAKEYVDGARCQIVKDPNEADQHWFIKTDYTTFLWWYMVNVGLKDDAWQQEYSTYTDLDTRHKILYDDHVKTQLETLDLWPDTSTMVPFYGWDINVLKIGFHLPADMECDLASDAWLAWLERHTPNVVKQSRRPKINSTA